MLPKTDTSAQNIYLTETELFPPISDTLIAILLRDHTTSHNIIWATDSYAHLGKGFAFQDEITCEKIFSKGESLIKPRVEKSKEEQQGRIRDKAEVFTPAWVCNMQNNLVDEEWFGKKNIFNTETKRDWKTNKTVITFPSNTGKMWQDYVSSVRLEMACGEAPYITSRYDAASGKYIEVKNRIGLLDRKLRAVTENTQEKTEWLQRALQAVKCVYGFEWQGDNILIARQNLLLTVSEFYKEKFEAELTEAELATFAEIISWNIWQMDGLKFVVPQSCHSEKVKNDELFLFDEIQDEQGELFCECEGCKKNDAHKHNGIYAQIMDWNENKKIRFVDLIGRK